MIDFPYSRLLSEPAQRVLKHLAELPPNRSLQDSWIAGVAGLDMKRARDLKKSLIEHDLVLHDSWFWPNGGVGKGIKITAGGRATLASVLSAA